MAGRAARNQEVLKSLRNGEYKMVLLGPPDYLELKDALISSNFTRYYNCSVTIPNGYYMQTGGIHISTVWFRDKIACKEMKDKVLRYYSDHFGEICSKSRFAADTLKKYVFPRLGITYTQETYRCNGGKEYFHSKPANEGGDAQTYPELFRL
ncbi:MAG: hypothetical protein V1875_05440, partial [Candidatus Altiarchaeota archaeon]